MFQSLSDRLGGIFDGLRGKGALRESDVDQAMREIRIALLEADVALSVVKSFIERVKEDAIGQEVIKGVNPAQQVVKIVNDAMVDLLGGTEENDRELKFASAPCAYLMVGLQGSGKTTTTAKIGRFLTTKQNKKVLMASLDVARPAAQEQLRVLGEQTEVTTLEIIAGQNPTDIAERAMDTARKEGYDLVILDTAGRLSIDEDLMNEAKAIHDIAKPVETLLVADAMTGQDAVNTATAFNEKIGITGVVLTRVDGDSRGGAAMSMKAITGKPIKLLGMGEKWDELELFHPDRMASRILGMGDVVSLVEKAVETVDQEAAEKMAEKFKKGKFDFNDMLTQFGQISKMGGAGSLIKMLPGLGKMAKQMEEGGLDDDAFKKQEALILSMTKHERENPEVLNGSRKKRIAAGAGSSVQELNRLVKQLQQMQSMMKKMRKMGMGNMMGMMKNMMGKQDADMLMEGMDPAALEGGLDGMPGAGGPLGANPFAQGGMPPGGLGDLMAPGQNPLDALGGGMGGGRSPTKKMNKRKKKQAQKNKK
jgi:signal recognition particle subunit SRP54